MIIDVSGVFISCETLVISSVLKRSLFIFCSTARAMPSFMLLMFRACTFKSPSIRYSLIFSSVLPFAILSVPFLISLNIMQMRIKVTATAKLRNNKSNAAPSPPEERIKIKIKSTIKITEIIRADFQTVGIFRKV